MVAWLEMLNLSRIDAINPENISTQNTNPLVRGDLMSRAKEGHGNKVHIMGKVVLGKCRIVWMFDSLKLVMHIEES